LITKIKDILHKSVKEKYGSCWRNLKTTELVDYVGIDGRIILKRILKE